jgi:hypothetical protein
VHTVSGATLVPVVAFNFAIQSKDTANHTDFSGRGATSAKGGLDDVAPEEERAAAILSRLPLARLDQASTN